MTEDRDREVAALFRAERAHDERSAPAFARVASGRHEAARRPFLSLRLAAALAAAVLVAVLLARLTKPQPLFAFTPGDLRVPTDYLLDLALSPRAGEIPRIGTVDWYPLSPTDAIRREQ